MTNTQTLLDSFLHWETTTPNKVWLNQPLGENQWMSTTWAEAGVKARKLASALQSLGLSKNAKIAIVSKNCDAWMISDIAIQMAGYVSVPIFNTMTEDSVRYVLEHAEAECILMGSTENWSAVLSALPDSMPAIVFTGAPDQQLNNGTRTVLPWDKVMSEFSAEKLLELPKPNDLITIVYTSGTTGLPKGVVHTQQSFANISIPLLEGCQSKADSVFFSYLPLAHMAERGAVFVHVLACGGEVFFNESLETFADDLKHARPTWFLAVPRIWTKLQLGVIAKFGNEKLQALMSNPETAEQTGALIRQGFGLDRAEYLATGSAPLSIATHEWFESMGMPLYDVYGMSEGLPATMNLKSARKVGTLGRVIPGGELKLSEQGEILYKMPSCMLGYYKDEEKTKEALVDGWMHTGDKGEIDSEGYLKLTGRLKELYKTSKGKYVAPAPIEGKVARNSNFEMLCLMGEGMPSSVMVAVLSETGMKASRDSLRNELPEFFRNINEQLDAHERMSHVLIAKDSWTIENGLLTHTMKLKRNELEDKYLPVIGKTIADDAFVIFEEEIDLLVEC